MNQFLLQRVESPIGEPITYSDHGAFPTQMAAYWAAAQHGDYAAYHVIDTTTGQRFCWRRCAGWYSLCESFEIGPLTPMHPVMILAEAERIANAAWCRA